MSWGHYLFGFSGRINRLPYWQALLVGLGFLLVGVVIAVPYLAIEHPTLRSHGLSFLGIATIAAECLLIVAYFVFALAITVKRLHDRNRSAWWLIPFVLVPQLLRVMADPRMPSQTHVPLGLAVVMTLIGGGLGLWAFIELGILRGTVGDNRFGPDPLARYGPDSLGGQA